MKKKTIWYNKIVDLRHKYKLGFLQNPGGGQFINRSRGIDIQAGLCDDEDDYYMLKGGLINLGLERTDE